MADSGAGSARSSGRNLSVEMTGEGVLPRVTIVKPVLRQVPTGIQSVKDPQPFLLFPRIRLGQQTTLPVTIKNASSFLPCTAVVTMVQPQQAQAFCMSCGEGGDQRLVEGDEFAAAVGELVRSQSRRGPRPVSEQGGSVRQQLMLKLPAAQEASFDVAFQPSANGVSQCSMFVNVASNQFEQLQVFVSGDGYEDDITVENLPEYRGDLAKKEARKGGPPSAQKGTFAPPTCNHEWFPARE